MAKTSASTSETRRFRIDPHAIMSLIGAQAGTLQKALLEGVANSIDAGASRVDIEADAHSVSVADDGRGLDKSGIEQHFEVFGFDHSTLDRRIGRFGVGRGQLFCFGKNTWRTGVHEMHVDIKANGLDYELTSRSKPRKGMSIGIELYEKLTPYTLNQLEEDLRRLVRFSIVPVFFNGKKLSEDPSKRKKWTEETDEAWFNLRKDGKLAIYSQGLLVQEYDSYRYGCGGEVITKPGHALRQNLARNEILENDCPVWKKLGPRLRKAGNAFRGEAARTGTMNEGQRKSMALQALDPTTGLENYTDSLLDESLFTLNNGRHVKLEVLLRRQVVAVAASRDLKADKLIQGGVAQVLDPVTLDRFGVETPTELAARLVKALDARLALGGNYPHRARYMKEMLDQTVFHDSIKDLADLVDDSFEEVPVRKLPPDQRAALGCISRLAWRATRVMNHALGLDERDPLARRSRTLMAMKCATMDACTDGGAYGLVQRQAAPGRVQERLARLPAPDGAVRPRASSHRKLAREPCPRSRFFRGLSQHRSRLDHRRSRHDRLRQLPAPWPRPAEKVAGSARYAVRRHRGGPGGGHVVPGGSLSFRVSCGRRAGAFIAAPPPPFPCLTMEAVRLQKRSPVCFCFRRFTGSASSNMSVTQRARAMFTAGSCSVLMAMPIRSSPFLSRTVASAPAA